MNVPNHTPPPATPITANAGPGGEWLNEFPRPSIIPRLCQLALGLAAVIGFIAVVVAAVSVAVG